MNALILAAGFGTRLGKYAANLPKPLLEISGVPLLETNIEKMKKIGVSKIYVNGHYKSYKIREFLDKKYGDTDLINFVYEPEILGTAGTIQKLCINQSINELVVMHGDNYFQDNLFNMVNKFRTLEKQFFGVVGTFKTQQPQECGIFEIVSEKIINVYEKSQNFHGNVANSATYILGEEALKVISNLKTGNNDLSIHFLQIYFNKLKPIPLEGYFIDIGSPENLKFARSLEKSD